MGRFFGGTPGEGPRRIDLGRLMSQDAREVVQSAAAKAADLGSADLDTDHLLWALTQRDPLRQLLSRAGADPAALAAEIEQRGRRGPARSEAPTLTPAAKRALLQAHQISRALGASYLGPEHILLALVVNRESEAGRLLSARGVTAETLQAAAESPAAPARGAASAPTLEQYGRGPTGPA